MQLNQELSSNSFFVIGLLTIILLSASVCHVEKKLPTTKVEVMKEKAVVARAALPSPVLISVNKDDILGVWHPKDEDFNIEIFKAEEEYHGKIVWLKNPTDGSGKAKLDKLNPQKNLRKKPILGLVAIKGFEFDDGEKIWDEGFIYNPMTGQSLKGSFKMIDSNTLELSGFLGFSLSEVQIIWKRM